MTGTMEARVFRQVEGHPFAQGLLPEDVEAMADRAELVAFSSRDAIFRAGDPADTFYLVRSGVIELTVDAQSGFPEVIQHISEKLGGRGMLEPTADASAEDNDG